MDLEPLDLTSKKDMELLENIANLERVVQRQVENNDFASAAEYTSQILGECPESVHHASLKIEYMLKASQLEDAVKYTEQLMRNPDFKKVPVIQGWRGRVLIYSGNEVTGKKILMEALKIDPDNSMLKTSVKNIKKSNDLKDEASKLFKESKVQEAIAKFKLCLEVDPLNLSFNSTIYLNLAIGLSKNKKNDDALNMLNKAITMNPNYAKAYVKRGEINQILENYQEAVRDF